MRLPHRHGREDDPPARCTRARTTRQEESVEGAPRRDLKALGLDQFFCAGSLAELQDIAKSVRTQTIGDIDIAFGHGSKRAVAVKLEHELTLLIHVCLIARIDEAVISERILYDLSAFYVRRRNADGPLWPLRCPNTRAHFPAI